MNQFVIAGCITLLYFSSQVFAEVDKWPSTESDHSNFNVIVPSHLSKKGGYQHKDALFGYPAYHSGSLQTQLVYIKVDGCSKIDTSKLVAPFALMIDRGSCKFVEKIRNAQHAGARAVVVADNKCLCGDTECMSTTKDTACESNLPYMADDESGGDVTIPSMLIRKSDADAIKAEMNAEGGVQTNVMVKFEWGIPSPDGRVEWTMWHSSWDEQSLIALRDMEILSEALEARAFFTPRFVSYNGSQVGCHTKEMKENPCGNMCLNAGRYCLLDPSPFHDQSNGASGQDVVLENLRRKCIWRNLDKSEAGEGRTWWHYVNMFGEKCSKNENTFKDPNCAKGVMKTVGIDIDVVEKCMQPYGPNVDQVNQMLEEELREQTSLQLLRLPALYVDGVHARGVINAYNALDMMCAGYGVHDPPAVCECVDQPAKVLLECVKAGGLSAMISPESAGGVGFGTLFFVILLVVGGLGGTGYVYWKRSQLQMREQVRSIIAEYMPLEDQSDDLDSPRMHPAALASVKSPRGYLPSRGLMDDADGDGV